MKVVMSRGGAADRGRSPGMRAMMGLLLMSPVTAEKFLPFWFLGGNSAFPGGAQRSAVP